MGAPPPLAEYFYNDSLSYLVEVASRTTSSLEGTIPVNSKGKVPLIFKEPIGAVLSIAPWNAASILAMRGAATPLAAGCPVVFKSSEKSPLTHWLTLKCLTEAGLPPGAFNFVNSSAENAQNVVEALIAHPAIRKVNFTGSTLVGRQIAVAAARELKPIVLELGGKSPCIIDSNMTPELKAQAVENALFSAWHANGQICMSTERIYVVREFYDEFIERLAAKAGNGPLLHFEGGHPQSSVDAVKGVYNLIEDAVSKGARMVAGQLNPNMTSNTSTDHAYIGKTILTGVTPEMRIFSEESFGPVAFVHPVESLQEAVALSNENDYGLSASVWTSDIAKGIAVGRALKSGAVHINGSVSSLAFLFISLSFSMDMLTKQTIHDDAVLPHGGVKGSGFGRFGAKWGLDEYLITKGITLPEVTF